VIDGNGAAWWDGIGSNGGIAKPDHMIVASGISGYGLFRNLYSGSSAAQCCTSISTVS
jgi:polygalacturonase